MLDALVESEDVEHLEVLALVLVDALDENVKQGIGVDGDVKGLEDIGSEPLLVVVLDGAPLAREFRVVDQGARVCAVFQDRESNWARDAQLSKCARRGVAGGHHPARGVTPLVLLENFSG